MPDVAELSIPITADPKAVSAALAQVEAQLHAAERAGEQAGKGIGAGFNQAVPPLQQTATATEQTAQSALRLAQAEARLQTSQGNLAGASSTLSTALAQQQTRTVAVVNAEAQLERIQARLRTSTTQTGVSFRSMLSNVASAEQRIAAFAGAAQVAAGGLAAFQLAKTGYEFAQMGANAAAAKQSFDALATSAGVSGAAMLASLKSAAAGTVSEVDLIKNANTALLLIGDQVAGKLPKMLEIARAAAVATGQDVGFLFESLVTGVARGSTELLDNLGISISATEATAAYAAQIGKSADSLTKAERSQAILNAVLAQGDAIIARTGGTTQTAATSFQQMGAAAVDLGTGLAQLTALAAGPLISALAGVTQAAAEGVGTLTQVGGQVAATAQQVAVGATSYEDYRQRVAATNQALAGIGQTIPILSQAQWDYAQSLMATGMSAEVAFAQLATGAETVNVFREAVLATATTNEEAVGSLIGLEPAIVAVSSASEQGAAAMQTLIQSYLDGRMSVDELAVGVANLQASQQAAAEADAIASSELAARRAIEAQSTEAAAQAAMVHASALEEDAAKALLAAARSEELRGAKAVLEAQARSAAQALLASGEAGAAAAARLANSASLVDQLTAAYYRLMAAQQAASVATARMEQNSARLNAEYGRADTRAAAVKVKTLTTQMRAAKVGVYAPAPKARAGGGGGGGGAKGAGAKKAGGGAAKAPQLSDQEKLNNTLLANEEKFQQKAEDAEAAHQQRLIDIIEQYNAKQLAAQQDLQVKSATSRYSFYDQLTQAAADLNKTQKGAGTAITRQLAAQYEAAFQKAQEFAQQGQAQLGQEYLALRQKQLQEDLRNEQALADAKEKKDKAEVARLTALEALRKAAQQAELDAVMQGGDANVAARDKALAAETEKYAEQTATISTEADRAAQAKILAAQRSKQAVDAENLSLQQQADLYRAIPGGKAAVAGAGGTATTGGVAAAAAAAAAPQGVQLVKDPEGSQIAADGFSVLSTKLDGLTTQVGQLAPRIEAVERAVGHLRSRSVVGG